MYSVKDLHYGIKRRINKVDSLQNRNLYVEQIDDYLNEALNIFIQELIKVLEYDIEADLLLLPLKVNDSILQFTNHDGYIIAELPSDFFHYIKSFSNASSTCCSTIATIKHIRIQEDDETYFLEDPFYKPSYQYRETGVQLLPNGLKIFTGGELYINEVKLSYIKKHPRLGNPEMARFGAYTLPNGLAAIQQDLLLDNKRQFDMIMDIAALLISTDINSPTYQQQLNKIINLNNLIKISRNQ